MCTSRDSPTDFIPYKDRRKLVAPFLLATDDNSARQNSLIRPGRLAVSYLHKTFSIVGTILTTAYKWNCFARAVAMSFGKGRGLQWEKMTWTPWKQGCRVLF